MKLTTTILILFVCFSGYGQFHVKVECNPDNDGKVNPAWKNNYVIAYTLNNWQSEFIIFSEATYSGFDDNGKVFYESVYEQLAFQKIEDAASIANGYFHDEDDVGEFEGIQYGNHIKSEIKYTKENKKLCFGCKEVTETCQTINIR